jgi:hypothetical protein
VIDQIGGRNTVGEEAAECLFAGAMLRAGVGIARVIAASPYAVVLLRDVRERQKVRERTRHGQRRVDWHLPQKLRESIEVFIPIAPVARTLRERADALDALVQVFTAVLAQHVAQKVAQKMDIVPKRLMRIDSRLVCRRHVRHRDRLLQRALQSRCPALPWHHRGTTPALPRHYPGTTLAPPSRLC